MRMTAAGRKHPARRPVVTLVIPAHNEAGRIERTARTALRASLVRRVIIVDDGSDDGTSERAAAIAATDPRLAVLRSNVNRGKSAALLHGIQSCGTSLIAFLDADLIHLTPGHIDDLIRPVLSGACEMSIGVFRGGRLHTDLAHMATPFLSGQRCLRWDRFRDAPLLEDARYGIEVALSLHARLRGLRVCPVIWRGVTHVTKAEKLGLVHGYLAYLGMYAEIVAYVARLSLRPLARLWRTPAGSARIDQGH